MTDTTLLSNSFKTNRIFFDEKNYPRGISRSGDYSIAEVKIIETYGIALMALTDGSQAPQTEEEEQFVAVIHDQQPATTKIEKAWLKYLQKTRTPKKLHTLFGKSKVSAEAASNDIEETSDNTDLDID